jgi:hypothetical protein
MELQGDRETVVFKSLPCAKNDSLNLEVIHQSQSNEALSPVLVQSVGYFPAIGSGWILSQRLEEGFRSNRGGRSRAGN